MTSKELEETTPRQFFNRINGHKEKEQHQVLRDRNNFEALRSHAFLILSPNFKKGAKLKVTDIWQFPWDEAKVEHKEQDQKKSQIDIIRKLIADGRASDWMIEKIKKIDAN